MHDDPTRPPTSPPPSVPPRLLDQLRLAARQRGYPEPTVAAFADYSRRFILFHGKRHPRELGLPEIGQFLESIAQSEKDPLLAEGPRHVDELVQRLGLGVAQLSGLLLLEVNKAVRHRPGAAMRRC
jgi:hypothetical protein